MIELPVCNFPPELPEKQQKLYTFFTNACARQYFRQLDVSNPAVEVKFTMSRLTDYNGDHLQDHTTEKSIAFEISEGMPGFFEASGKATTMARRDGARSDCTTLFAPSRS